MYVQARIEVVRLLFAQARSLLACRHPIRGFTPDTCASQRADGRVMPSQSDATLG